MHYTDLNLYELCIVGIRKLSCDQNRTNRGRMLHAASVMQTGLEQQYGTEKTGRCRSRGVKEKRNAEKYVLTHTVTDIIYVCIVSGK